MANFCAQCGAALGERAKFCHRCGASREGSGSAAPSGGANTIIPWAITATAVLAFIAFLAGQRFGGRAETTAAAPPAATGARAVDISSLTPQQRADRLFDRMMILVTEGKSDSVQFFAPMAIQSFEALAPLDAHQRYDLGLIGVVSGDGALARAQADTILRAQPSHLLGLILAMRAAGLSGDTAARDQFFKRLNAALVSERAKGLPEYTDHGPDIDAAVRGVVLETPSRQ
jgi:hypothetical protein